jgi:hypothetical protein
MAVTSTVSAEEAKVEVTNETAERVTSAADTSPVYAAGSIPADFRRWTA